MLSATPQWTSTGFARRGVEDRTAFFEGAVCFMGAVYVYTQVFQSAWTKGTGSDRAVVEGCAVVVRHFDMRSELIESGERPKDASIEAATCTADKDFCRFTAVYSLNVPGTFVSTLERSLVCASVDNAFPEDFFCG